MREQNVTGAEPQKEGFRLNPERPPPLIRTPEWPPRCLPSGVFSIGTPLTLWRHQKYAQGSKGPVKIQSLMKEKKALIQGECLQRWVKLSLCGSQKAGGEKCQITARLWSTQAGPTPRIYPGMWWSHRLEDSGNKPRWRRIWPGPCHMFTSVIPRRRLHITAMTKRGSLPSTQHVGLLPPSTSQWDWTWRAFEEVI